MCRACVESLEQEQSALLNTSDTHSARALTASCSTRAPLAACRLHVERRHRHVQRLTHAFLSSASGLNVRSQDAVHAHDILPHAGHLNRPATSRLMRCGDVLRHGVCASNVALSSFTVAVALLWRQRPRGATAGGGTRAVGARSLAARQRAARRAA